MQTDYSLSSKLILAYPERYYNEYDALTHFYDELINLLPNDFQIWIISNNNQTIQKLKEKYDYKKIDFLGIKGWDEIWLRDCIGIQNDNYVIKPEYFPKYCKKDSLYKNYFQNLNRLSRIIIKEILGKEIIEIPLILDGGNFINNGKYALMTNKILFDNGIFRQKEIEKIITDTTGLQPIFIERNKYDNIGHIDAYVSFIDNETVLIPNYPSFPFLKDDIDFINNLEKQLTALGLKIIKMEERPVDEIGICSCQCNNKNHCVYSARGNYINFLRLNNLIVLPEFNLPTKKVTNYYNQTNGAKLEELDFEVRRINCDSLAKHGGLLHCISYVA